MLIRGRYEYDPSADLLGKGGFARVFRARDQLLNREVALKVFSKLGQDQYSVLAEIRKAIQLEHPNLLRYYDVLLLEQSNALDETEELQIGVMEYANAGDLKSYVRAHPGSPLLPRFLREILQGLEYLHAHGIIHRDLKAQNILLVERNGALTAKISDFGISKNLKGDNAESSSMLVGTIEYMAPEQFNPSKFGIDGKIGSNVDLWSFGVMVHELLTDATPFGRRDGNTTAEQIMAAILAPDLPEQIEKLPEPYRAVVKLCLVANAKARIRSAAELLSSLGDPHFAAHSNDNLDEFAGAADATRIYSKPEKPADAALDANQDGDDLTRHIAPQTRVLKDEGADREGPVAAEADTEKSAANITSTPVAANLSPLSEQEAVLPNSDADRGVGGEPPDIARSPSSEHEEQDSDLNRSAWLPSDPWKRLRSNRFAQLALASMLVLAMALFGWSRWTPEPKITDDQFITSVAHTSGVTQAESGLITLPDIEGQGASPKLSDFVMVRINLAKADGSQLYLDGSKPVLVRVGDLMPLLRGVVTKMKPGGRMRFWLPLNLVEPKLLATPIRTSAASAPQYSLVTTLVGAIELGKVGTRGQLSEAMARPDLAANKTHAKLAAPSDSVDLEDAFNSVPQPTSSSCHQECTSAAGPPSFVDRISNVRAGVFSYPTGSAIPQDRARALAAQACGQGSLSTYSARVDGECGGNVCFAAVTATCRSRESVVGPQVQTCKSVCK